MKHLCINMGRLKSSFLHLTVLFISGAVGQDIGNFPLSDCNTGQFDILILHTTSNYFDYKRTAVANVVANTWNQENNGNLRVRVSSIREPWPNYYTACDIQLTRFDKVKSEFCSKFPYTDYNSNSSVYVDINLKIQLARAIFSDLAIGRQNSTHVAVLVLQSLKYPKLTANVIKKIPDIVQENNRGIKVFVTVFDADIGVEQILLKDTLIIGKHVTSHVIPMALCKQCLPGWFQLGYKETSDSLSCYKLHISPTNIRWVSAWESCSKIAYNLATVESKEELDFLQAQLLFRLLENRHNMFDARDSAGDTFKVYIGLKRDSTTVAKRFQWTFKRHRGYHRPLVVNHWLPGNPAGGFNHACVVWLYKGIFKDVAFGNSSTSKTLPTENRLNIREGWSNAGCGTQVSSVSLCEVTLSRIVKEGDLIIVNHANRDSFNRALNSGDFLELEGSIVSVAAFLNDNVFLSFMKVKNIDLPMFNCLDKTENPRYISYSYVSDFIKHCSNGRDENMHSRQLCLHCQCIPDEAVCDNVIDCVDGSDEEYCNTCMGRRCCDGTCLPSHLFHDGEIDCINCKTINKGDVNDESRTHEVTGDRNETCAFICNRKQCIYPSQLYDGKLDCTGPEGPLDETIGKLEKSKSCFDIFGRLIWAPRCVYLIDRYGSVLGCRDLSHLQNCSDFPCQEGYYKCPGSYCIPLHYVMDGKSDCPVEEEERNIMNYTCMGNFDCWNSPVCLHPDLVCDGAAQCPHKDDELNCGVSCIHGLLCVAGTVIVDSSNPLLQLDNIKFMSKSTRYLDLSGVDLSNTEFEDQINVLLFEVKLSGCKILNLYYKFPLSFCCMAYVYRLDLSFNPIVSINGDNQGKDFGVNLKDLNLSYNTHLEEFINVKCEYLETLDLSNTGLNYLGKASFSGFPNLKNLSLSYTRLFEFYRDIFPAGFTLESLDLRGSPIVHFYQNTYNDLTITSSLYTDNFGLCCPQVRGANIPAHMCHASDDAISSCFDLIDADIQQILLWLMAGVALIGNMIVILYRLTWDRQVLEKAYGLFVLNLAISDLIMGLYLLMIAAADVYYRGVYVMYDNEWKESVFCKIAGVLATLSNETSTFFIFLITVDRFLVLKFPYGQKQFSRITKIGAISLSWGVGFLLALIPVLPIFGNDKVLSSTAMCNGLIVTNQRVSGWEFSLGVFIVFNFIMFLLTALGQVGIFIVISQNRMAKESTNQNSFRRAQDITVTKQLSLVVLSNFLCWFPVSLLGFLSLAGHEINAAVYTWAVVLVLPVNSAINPLLYTIPFLMAKWELLKSRSSRRH